MLKLPKTASLDLELDDSWLTVWFNQPHRRNVLTAEAGDEIRAVCASLQGQRDIRGVTFRGRGSVFCAGADLALLKSDDATGVDREFIKQYSRGGGEMFHAVNELPQVTVMAVEGAAIAGGLGLVCAGDVVVVERAAKFSLTETMIGLSPAQIAPLVIQRLGRRLARRLILTGATFDGSQALELGLADYVVDGAEGMDRALADIEKQVRRCAPGAVADTKKLILGLSNLSKQEQIDLAADVFAERVMSDEGREGVASFMEKRKPDWAAT